MNHAEKASVVENLAGKFQQAPIAILSSYRGLTVAAMTELRGQVRKAEGELLVAKNTLMRLAVKDTKNSVIEPMLSGTTVLAFGYGDPVAVAKVLDEFAGKNEALTLKGAVLEGEFLDAGQVGKLAKMPSRDVMRAQLLALLMTPATQLVRVLSAPAQGVAQVLDARRRQLAGEE